jgi:hypothetical protein
MRRTMTALFLSLAACAAGAQSSRTASFPSVEGKDLNDRSLSLPADFAAPASLVFVAFERSQQEEVDTWKPFVTEMQRLRPGLRFYELPAIGKGYTWLRGFIDGGMRSGIPDPDLRASTVTLYIDVAPFVKALGIESTKKIAAFVVAPSGEILARSSGRWSESSAAPLAEALKALP